MSPVKANSPVKGSKTPTKAKDNKFTPPKTRRRSMKPSTPKPATPIPATPEQKKTPKKQKTPKPETQTLKAGKENKTPVMDKQTPKKVHSEKKKVAVTTPAAVKTPKKARASSGGRSRTMTPAEKEAEDKTTLFLKGLPKGCTTEQIQAVSSDIVEVRLRDSKYQTKGSSVFAFVQFKSEATMTSNFEKMKKIDGKMITVDYCGSKSTKQQKRRAERVTDSTTLYATGLGFTGEDIEKMKNMFPKNTKIDVPKVFSSSRSRGFAFVHFANAKDAAVAQSSHNRASVNGETLILSVAELRGKPEARETKKAKVEKVAQKAESEEEDDDDEMEDDEDSSDE